MQDPGARRAMWGAIMRATEAAVGEAGTSVVLTTHLLEECEALCTRVGILHQARAWLLLCSSTHWAWPLFQQAQRIKKYVQACIPPTDCNQMHVTAAHQQYCLHVGGSKVVLAKFLKLIIWA